MPDATIRLTVSQHYIIVIDPSCFDRNPDPLVTRMIKNRSQLLSPKPPSGSPL